MRTSFDEAMGTVPASTIDVDTIIARGRRSTAYRRLGMSAAGLGGVAGIVALALSAGPLGRVAAPGPPAQVGGPPVGTTAPESSPEARTTEPLKETERRLRNALKQIIGEQLPGARTTAGFPPLAEGHLLREATQRTYSTVPADYFEGQATLIGIKPGRFFLQMGTIGPGFDVDTSCRNWKHASCRVEKGARGETIVQIAGDDRKNGEPDSRFHRVYVRKADGTGVMVDANNGIVKPPPGGADPVLTLDQLVAIATDPRLDLRR